MVASCTPPRSRNVKNFAQQLSLVHDIYIFLLLLGSRLHYKPAVATNTVTNNQYPKKRVMNMKVNMGVNKMKGIAWTTLDASSNSFTTTFILGNITIRISRMMP